MLYTSQVDCRNRCVYILGLHTWISAERQREGFLGIIFSAERGGKNIQAQSLQETKRKEKKEKKTAQPPTLPSPRLSKN